jgi:hypothetical protein
MAVLPLDNLSTSTRDDLSVGLGARSSRPVLPVSGYLTKDR